MRKEGEEVALQIFQCNLCGEDNSKGFPPVAHGGPYQNRYPHWQPMEDPRKVAIPRVLVSFSH